MVSSLGQHLDHEGDGDKGAQGGPEVGEDHDQKNPGDLVPPESLERSDVVEEALEILHLGLGNGRLHQSRDPAGRNQRVKGGEGCCSRGREDRERMTECSGSACSGENCGGQGPPLHHFRGGRQSGIEEPEENQAHDKRGDAPSEDLAQVAFGRELLQGGQIDFLVP